MYMYMYMCVYVCVYIYRYKCIYIYTNTLVAITLFFNIHLLHTPSLFSKSPSPFALSLDLSFALSLALSLDFSLSLSVASALSRTCMLFLLSRTCMLFLALYPSSPFLPFPASLSLFSLAPWLARLLYLSFAVSFVCCVLLSHKSSGLISTSRTTLQTKFEFPQKKPQISAKKLNISAIFLRKTSSCGKPSDLISICPTSRTLAIAFRFSRCTDTNIK